MARYPFTIGAVVFVGCILGGVAALPDYPKLACCLLAVPIFGPIVLGAIITDRGGRL